MAWEVDENGEWREEPDEEPSGGGDEGGGEESGGDVDVDLGGTTVDESGGWDGGGGGDVISDGGGGDVISDSAGGGDILPAWDPSSDPVQAEIQSAHDMLSSSPESLGGSEMPLNEMVATGQIDPNEAWQIDRSARMGT